MIVILSGVALGGLIAASPTLISDWIFRTGQHTFTVYNSSTQAIESVDNRNKGRKQYGALSVDGALYANSTINATGAINIGADVSLSRSAADVLTTADTVVTATQEIIGTGNSQIFNYLAAQGSLSMIDGRSLQYKSTQTDWNSFYVGSPSVTRGLVYISGHGTGSAAGGSLLLGVADDYNSTISAYYFQPIYDDLYIGPSSDTDSLIYDAGDAQWKFTGSGGIYVAGAIYGVGNISGLSFTDRTPGSPEDALNEISKWKVTGDQVDHDSLGTAMVTQAVTKTGFEISNKEGESYNTISKIKKMDNYNRFSIDFFKAIEDFDAGKEIPAEYMVKEVTEVVQEKGRDLSKTVSILSRAVQQLSERLDKLEGR